MCSLSALAPQLNFGPLSHLTEDGLLQGHQTIRGLNVKRRTPLTRSCCCFLHKHRREPSTPSFNVSVGKNKNHTQTHCRSCRACLSSQSLIISPTDVFWVFHMLQMKAIGTHTGQSKHLLKREKKKKRVTHNSTKALQTCSGRAVARDDIGYLNTEGAGRATEHWQGY